MGTAYQVFRGAKSGAFCTLLLTQGTDVRCPILSVETPT